MLRKIRFKFWWVVFALGFTGFVVAVYSAGKLFFVNRTQSMPIGIYIKRSRKDFEVGDIIVFNQNGNKTNLIKYVAAASPAIFCVDDQGTFWVNDFPVGQLNIEKYPSKIASESYCDHLQADEILTLGDHPNSYDSRYFGPVKIKDVIARVELLWQFEWRTDDK